MQAQLREAGINGTLEAIDAARLTGPVFRGDFDSLYVGQSSGGATATQGLRGRWGTGGGLNGPQLSDANSTG